MAILGKNSHFLTQILTNKKKLFFVDYAPGHFWQYQFVLTFFKSSVFLNFFLKKAGGRFNFTVWQKSSVHWNIDFLKRPLVTSVPGHLTLTHSQLRHSSPANRHSGQLPGRTLYCNNGKKNIFILSDRNLSTRH